MIIEWFCPVCHKGVESETYYHHKEDWQEGEWKRQLENLSKDDLKGGHEIWWSEKDEDE